MKENSIEEDIKIINNFITYFNKNIQNGNKADLTVLGEEINAIEHVLSDYKRVLQENEKYKKFFDLMLRLDSDYFMNCGDEETIKLVDEILKLESEE